MQGRLRYYRNLRDVRQVHQPYTVEVAFGSIQASSAFTQLTSLIINGSTDGGGGNNHAWKVVDLGGSPIAIPGPTVVTFRTISLTGTVQSGRMNARLCRQVGDYVSDVTFN